jgi:hypothetical protein
MGVIVPRSDADALIAQAMFRMQAQQRAVRQNFDTDLGSTPEEAEAQCELIRNDLAEYTRYVHQMEPQRHHLFWIDLLQKMEQRAFPQRKLLLLAPPNMAKSTYVSLIFVKWYLGRHPNHSVLFLTSADTNAGFFGSTVRAGLSDDFRHRTIFPEPACRPNVKRGWSSDGAFLMGTPLHQKDPAYRNVGWGASIIGARANVVIVDDPLSQKQAESPTEQSFAKRYHDMTVVPRLQRPDDANVDNAIDEGIEIAIRSGERSESRCGRSAFRLISITKSGQKMSPPSRLCISTIPRLREATYSSPEKTSDRCPWTFIAGTQYIPVSSTQAIVLLTSTRRSLKRRVRAFP